MTKRQAHTLTALAVAVILTQILCTAVLLRGMARLSAPAESASTSRVDVIRNSNGFFAADAEVTPPPAPAVEESDEKPTITLTPPECPDPAGVTIEPAPGAPKGLPSAAPPAAGIHTNE